MIAQERGVARFYRSLGRILFGTRLSMERVPSRTGEIAMRDAIGCLESPLEIAIDTIHYPFI